MQLAAVISTCLSFLVMLASPGCGSSSQGAGPQEQLAKNNPLFKSSTDNFPSLDSLPKWKGMTVAHEGYDGKKGYDGDMMGPSLDSLASLNVNAVAIVPYTFMRDPNVVAPLPIPDRVGSESDAAVRNAVSYVKAKGWKTLLKPQIWVRGYWPGDIDFDTEEKWQQFFEVYTTWILHHARFAQANDIEAFCIGTELRHTTLKRPDDWRSLVAKIRSVYSGTITYAANWGDEFEGITWWDEVDVIGLNAYYPLSLKPDPSPQELRSGAKEWMRKANHISTQYQRPLWLTEVGFRSVKQSWTNPHAAADGRAASNECQLKCYQALLTEAAESPRLTGMFFWKWPSYLGHGYEENNRRPGEGEGLVGFAPGGKPAALELEAFYAEW